MPAVQYDVPPKGRPTSTGGAVDGPKRPPSDARPGPAHAAADRLRCNAPARPALGTIQIELINEAGVSVHINVCSDDVETWLAGLFRTDTVNEGRLEPRAIERFSFDRNERGVILSDVIRSRFVSKANDFRIYDCLGQWPSDGRS